MSAIFILIGASVTVALGFLFAFIWSVRSGQYDDDFSPSVRMLSDDDESRLQENAASQKPKKEHSHGPRKNSVR